MKRRGLFITFEGIEGSGKSTQIKQLAAYLKNTGQEVHITREPGGTDIGMSIRRILLNPDLVEMDYHTEVLLYAADRAQHVAEAVIPALENDAIVISDRYLDSTIAYQHYGRGLPLDLIIEVNEWAVQNRKPDLTFLLDLPVEVGLERATKVVTDRIEQESVAFHSKVAAGFKVLAEIEPQRWRVLDGMKPVEEIHREVVEAVKALL